MATQIINDPELGEIRFSKRRGLKRISLRIDSRGRIRISAPWYTPQAAAISFARGKKDWLKSQQDKFSSSWHSGQMITPSLQLLIEFTDSQRPRSSKSLTEICVWLPNNYVPRTTYIEKVITSAQTDYCLKEYVPLTRKLAFDHGFELKDVVAKPLRSRWGSCDQKKIVTLSSFLASLPYDLVEYIIIHELAHTKHMNHSTQFWQTVTEILPEWKMSRKQLRSYQPLPQPYSVA